MCSLNYEIWLLVDVFVWVVLGFRFVLISRILLSSEELSIEHWGRCLCWALNNTNGICWRLESKSTCRATWWNWRFGWRHWTLNRQRTCKVLHYSRWMQNWVDGDSTKRCALTSMVVDAERQSVGSQRIYCKILFSGGVKI